MLSKPVITRAIIPCELGEYFILFDSGDITEQRYLHKDGIIRPLTKNHETGQYTGWFSTQEEAQKVLDEYNAKQQTNILHTPTDR